VPRTPPAFPTRRSSDLERERRLLRRSGIAVRGIERPRRRDRGGVDGRRSAGDRLAAPARGGSRERAPARRMRRRPRGGLALSTAAVAVAAYLLGVALSGRGGPIAQRPMFDGSGAIIPYHWVCPPQALAATNQKPTGAETTVRLGPKG